MGGLTLEPIDATFGTLVTDVDLSRLEMLTKRELVYLTNQQADGSLRPDGAWSTGPDRSTIESSG